jgi:hypothetical protein
MTLIRSDQVRDAIIDKIKANTTIMALLSDSNEVREAYWSGSEFTYPNYRVRINSITPFQDCYQNLDASILCYSEQASSQEAEEMAGTIANEFHAQSFIQDSIRFTHIVVDIIPAIKQDVRTWRSEVQLASLVNR